MKKRVLMGFGLLIVLGAGMVALMNINTDTATDTVADIATSTDGESKTQSSAKVESDYLGNYSIEDTGSGASVDVVIDEDAGLRKITSNALPNHETGEFPNDGNPNTISEQESQYEYPLTPTKIGDAQDVKEPGVAVNGIKFDPGTAESIYCSGSKQFRIEAIQSFENLGLDFNNAHVQPNGEYHYHGVSELLVNLYSTDNDLVHVGFASDGHLMYYSKSNAHKSGYALNEASRTATGCTRRDQAVDITSIEEGTFTSDWTFKESNGDLDECNGVMVGGEYVYLLTDSYPYIPRCLKGEVSQTQGGPPR